MRAPGHGAQLWDLHQFFGVQRQPSSPGIRVWVLDPLGYLQTSRDLSWGAIITPSLGRFPFFLAFLLFFLAFLLFPPLISHPTF